MGRTMNTRLGLAALVLSLVGSIPLLAGSVIFALLASGTRGSVFDALGELLAVIGPVVPSVFGGISLLALVLGVVANVRVPGQRDGIAAIVIVVAAPLIAFGILGVVIAL